MSVFVVVATVFHGEDRRHEEIVGPFADEAEARKFETHPRVVEENDAWHAETTVVSERTAIPPWRWAVENDIDEDDPFPDDWPFPAPEEEETSTA